MIKHVWFDVAGTLYRETTEFDKLHDKLRYETYAGLLGMSNFAQAQEEYDKLYDHYGSNSAVFKSIGQSSDFWQLAFESMDLGDVIKPNLEVNATIETISSFMPVSIFTNLKIRKIDSVLKLLQIEKKLFTHILSGDDVDERKPDLIGFRKMVELSELPPESVMYVGDRDKVDIIPARSIGMKTCLVWGESSSADYSVQSFSELAQIFSSRDPNR